MKYCKGLDKEMVNGQHEFDDILLYKKKKDDIFLALRENYHLGENAVLKTQFNKRRERYLSCL